MRPFFAQVIALLAALSMALLASPAAAADGAGATFPAPLYARWAAAWAREAGNGEMHEIRYQPIGSTAGIERITRGEVDFGASDIPLAPEELERRGLVQFPIVIGGVVPVIHVDGIGPAELKLDGRLLAAIYLGQVRKWNDPRIAALNPGLSLPSSRITVVRRADGSGTTRLWREYLALSDPAARDDAAWQTGVAATGNEGVAATVQRTRMAIGYVESSYAMQHRLNMAALRNHDGLPAVPSRPAFEAATEGLDWTALPAAQPPLLDRPGAQTWPIVGASFILLPAKATPRTQQVLAFFGWALRHGQGLAMQQDYVPLPPEAVAGVEALWRERYAP